MARLYVPKTPQELSRFCNGYTSPDGTEPALEPYPYSLQVSFGTVGVLNRNSYIQHFLGRGLLPMAYQSQEYTAGSLPAHTHNLEKNRTLGVILGYGRLYRASGATTDYVFPESKLTFRGNPSVPTGPRIGETALKETLKNLLEDIGNRHAIVRLLTPENQPPPDIDTSRGVQVVHPEGPLYSLAPPLAFRTGAKIELITSLPEVAALETQFNVIKSFALDADESRRRIETVYNSL